MVGVVLLLAAISDGLLAAAVWYFSSRPGQYLALMKRIQPSEVVDQLAARADQPAKKSTRIAAIICALSAAGRRGRREHVLV